MNNQWVDYPTPGKQYRHYKGGLYEVITLSTHSETGEVVVVYKSLLFGTVTHRPLSIWFEEVVINEELKTFKRFEECT